MEHTKIWITGTGKGIGKALAEYFLAKGNVSVIGISRQNEIQHPNFEFIKCDLSDTAGLIKRLDSFFDRKVLEDEKVALVNNAGILGEMKHIGKISAQSIVDNYNVNVTALALLMNSFTNKFHSHQAEKVILNISSGAGKSPVDGWATYCSSKAAVDMLSKVAHEETIIDDSGFKIFSCAPGVVDTFMQDTIRTADQHNFSKLEKFIQLKSENQLSNPEETASKLAQLIENPNHFSGVIQDVRNF